MTVRRLLVPAGLCAALLISCLLGNALANDPPVRFDVESDFGKESDGSRPT